MKSDFLETIKILDGKVYNLTYHQSRYVSVLNSFGISEYQNLADFIDPPKNGLYRCRLIYSPKTSKLIEVSYHKYEKRRINSLKIIHDDTIEYSKKYLAREAIEKLYNQREACDDILIIKNSLATDTSIANIAFFDGLKWITPRHPLLKGTTRERLLEEGKIIEANIKVDELMKFPKIALLNAMIDFDIITDISFIN